MTYTFEDVTQARRQREQQFERTVVQKLGTLLAYDYSDKATVKNRPGYVWYRDRGQIGGAAQALSLTVAPAPGLPVVLERRRPDETWEVVRVDSQAISAALDFDGSSFTGHHLEHEPGGNDQVWVYLRMLTPLRVSPRSGLTLRVNPYVYRTQGQLNVFKSAQVLDMSSYVPAAGLALYALVSLDTATNALQVTTGATSIYSGAISPAFPTAPTRSVPSAYVKLYGGQTEIQESDIVDGRLLFAGLEMAEDVALDTTNFDNLLSGVDDNLQVALDTLDDHGTHLSSVEYTDLTDGGDSALHYHATDRDRANHTGTQLAATISDIDTLDLTKVSKVYDAQGSPAISANSLGQISNEQGLLFRHEVYGLAGQGGNDLSMGVLYDRDELILADKRGTVTVTITGAGSVTAADVGLMFDGAGTFGSFVSTDNTTTKIEFHIDMGGGMPNYSNALWQPYIQYRIGMPGVGTYYNKVTVEVSYDNVNWYKPGGGEWETTAVDGQKYAKYGLWMGSNGNPSIPGAIWRYVRFTLEDRQENAGYASKDKVWIVQMGLRHVSAPGTRQFLRVDGGSLYGNVSSNSKIAANTLAVVDGVTEPASVTGQAIIYVDSADGDLKVKFADGTVKTIVTDS